MNRAVSWTRAKKGIATGRLASARPSLYIRALMEGAAPSTELRWAVERCAPKTVIDIGANRGQFSLLVAGIHPGARIVAFEPNPLEASKARRIFARELGFSIVTCALGRDPGEGRLHVTRRSDSASLNRPTAEQDSLFHSGPVESTVEVAIRRLDDVMAEQSVTGPMLVKIDVQGHEAAVVEGGRDTLAAAQWALVECSFASLYQDQGLADEVCAMLHGLGLRLEGAGNATTVGAGRLIQADLLFSRRT